MYQLRDYQSAACSSVWDYLLSSPGNPVVELPTGAGKSLCIADLCREAVQKWDGRVLVLAHRKELLSQNAEKIVALLPDIPVGIYSAGLKMRHTDKAVVCCGIQSVHKRAAEFGARHLVIIDEVHLVPTAGEGMYRAFLDDLRSINPKLRMVGMTATPYRTGEGALCRPDGLFQQICYTAPIPRLIEQGYLSRIISNVGDASADTSKLHVRAGEFINSELEQLFDVPAVVKAACAEIVAKSVGRQSILVFCSGVEHAKHVAQEISTLTGERCGTVTGDTLPMERANLLADFKARRLRWMTNVDVLTTGFDAPCIDCIAILRATCSPGLFSQICGRGFRLFAGKADCLILDFGENILRHGPLDAIDFGKPKKKNPDAEAPTKKCINCEQDVPLSAAVCPFCGFQFPPRELKHGEEADKLAQILSKPQDWLVEEVNMSRHRKARGVGPDTLQVDYICRIAGYEGNLALEKISEWVCLDHDGWAGQKAQAWWRKRSDAAPVAGDTGSWIDSCIDWWKRGAVATPTKITTIREGKFYRITNYVLDPIPPEENWQAEAVRGDVFEESELPF